MSRPATRALSYFSFVFALASSLAFVGRAGPRASDTKIPHPTFSKDIAPILFDNCAACHHPGGSGPFSLLTYPEVAQRAKQIAVVTRSRYMPPWPPEPGYGEFEGARRLSDEQINAIQQWEEQGAAEGDPADLPPPPKSHEGWQLGEPDLVVKMARPYTLRASGPDVFRNFVIPIPVSGTRYVRALEILPGNKRVVHHCNILIDRTGSARRLDEQDPGEGFNGMDVQLESERFEPDSHFLFWKPGTPPVSEPEDMAWRLEKDTDLVLNMHFYPSGKPEVIQPSIGLYFTHKPPTKFPMLIQLEHDGAIDIPPGKKDFLITDDFELPLDVQVLGVYPHAHYLGKDIQAYATLPDGTKKWLIWIKNWDIGWQAVYRNLEPISLPKGTVISMRYTYDNSADNVRNPNHPPRRVVSGNRSSDEMGHLWLQLLPRSREGLKMIQEALMRQRLRKYPKEVFAHTNLGSVLQSMGKVDEAINEFRTALEIKPDDVVALTNLGAALESLGKVDEATEHFRQALRVRPEYPNAHFNLGSLLLSQGSADEAARHFREVLRTNPDDADAHDRLGRALAVQGNSAEAKSQFEEAIRIDFEQAAAHYDLGSVLARQGNLAQAVAEFGQAVRLDPENADAHNDLGSALAMQGKLAEALAEFEQAVRINPAHAEARKNLARARAKLEMRN